MTALDDARWLDGSAALEATDHLPGGTAGVWLALPPKALPRILVPRTDLKIAAMSIRRLVSHGSWSRRASVGLTTAALANGGGALLPTNERWSIVAGRLLRLSREVSNLPEAIGVVRLSQQRPNRKPVVQLLDPTSGETVAFVKIGWDALSAPLIRNEAEALQSITAPNDLVIPTVLGYDDGAIPAVAAAPLPPAGPGGSDAVIADLARRALSIFGPDGLGGNGETTQLATTGLVSELSDQVAELRSSPIGPSLYERWGRMIDADGSMPTRPGRWHGDWVAGNANAHGDVVVAWDWERSHPSAPFGLDTAYALLSRSTPTQALVPLVELLGPDVSPRTAAGLLRLSAMAIVIRHCWANIAGITTDLDGANAVMDEALHL